MSAGVASTSVFSRTLDDHLDVVRRLNTELPLLEQVAERMYAAVKRGGKVLWFGNGGSAADAQHLAAELVGRFCRERPGMASIALTTDTSALTAIANDYGYERIFARQVEALCAPGDVVVGISTSGNSPNVCLGIERARELGAYTFAMTGETGGRLGGLADDCLRVGSSEAARIQEAHILAGHMLCEAIESALCRDAQAAGA